MININKLFKTICDTFIKSKKIDNDSFTTASNGISDGEKLKAFKIHKNLPHNGESRTSSLLKKLMLYTTVIILLIIMTYAFTNNQQPPIDDRGGNEIWIDARLPQK